MNKTVADLIQERFGLPSRVGHDIPAEGTVAQILLHRTHRRYKPDPVPDDVLEIVLAAALSAPSKSDLQQVAIVLVKDRAKQATIGGWIPDMPWIATAPLFMVFCGDNRRMRRVAEPAAGEGNPRHRPGNLAQQLSAARRHGFPQHLRSFPHKRESRGTISVGCPGCPLSRA